MEGANDGVKYCWAAEQRKSWESTFRFGDMEISENKTCLGEVVWTKHGLE